MKSDEADLQIAFFYRLKEIRSKCLQQALFEAIDGFDVSKIDGELGKHASKAILNKLARFGIRGEVFLPVPSLLIKRPNLLGYYRLLYGISQKEFSKKYSRFKSYEENIRKLVYDYIISSSNSSITIKNSLGRNIEIQFASDPDIVIIESLKSGENKIVSIEIKGGTDYSNAHNRLGEAEKSHQKAKQEGYNEFWTIVRVDIDLKLAKKESPTTTKFFNLDSIENEESAEAKKFAEMISSKPSIKL